jgi:hypothetical protein
MLSTVPRLCELGEQSMHYGAAEYRLHALILVNQVVKGDFRKLAPARLMHRSLSPIGMAPMSGSRIDLASSVTEVSGLTQLTPLCMASSSLVRLRLHPEGIMAHLSFRSMHFTRLVKFETILASKYSAGVLDLEIGNAVAEIRKVD